jgi:hypothetical protein
MAKLKGNLPRERVCVTLDGEVLAVTRVLKEKKGVSMSSMVEGLMLIGLKSKLRGETVE